MVQIFLILKEFKNWITVNKTTKFKNKNIKQNVW